MLTSLINNTVVATGIEIIDHVGEIGLRKIRPIPEQMLSETGILLRSNRAGNYLSMGFQSIHNLQIHLLKELEESFSIDDNNALGLMDKLNKQHPGAAHQGNVYTALRDMEKALLVNSEKLPGHWSRLGIPKVCYSITSHGRYFLKNPIYDPLKLPFRLYAYLEYGTFGKWRFLPLVATTVMGMGVGIAINHFIMGDQYLHWYEEVLSGTISGATFTLAATALTVLMIPRTNMGVYACKFSAFLFSSILSELIVPQES